MQFTTYPQLLHFILQILGASRQLLTEFNHLHLDFADLTILLGQLALQRLGLCALVAQLTLHTLQLDSQGALLLRRAFHQRIVVLRLECETLLCTAETLLQRNFLADPLVAGGIGAGAQTVELLLQRLHGLGQTRVLQLQLDLILLQLLVLLGHRLHFLVLIGSHLLVLGTQRTHHRLNGDVGFRHILAVGQALFLHQSQLCLQQLHLLLQCVDIVSVHG